jgi:hypothetical protein
MKVRTAQYFSLFSEVAGKGREPFDWEREYSESRSKVLDFEDIYWMGE